MSPFEPARVSVASKRAVLFASGVNEVTSACAGPLSLATQQIANVPTACVELVKSTLTLATKRWSPLDDAASGTIENTATTAVSTETSATLLFVIVPPISVPSRATLRPPTARRNVEIHTL